MAYGVVPGRSTYIAHWPSHPVGVSPEKRELPPLPSEPSGVRGPGPATTDSATWDNGISHRASDCGPSWPWIHPVFDFPQISHKGVVGRGRTVKDKKWLIHWIH